MDKWPIATRSLFGENRGDRVLLSLEYFPRSAATPQTPPKLRPKKSMESTTSPSVLFLVYSTVTCPC